MTNDYFVISQKVWEDIRAMRLYPNFLRCYIIFVYFVPFCGYINIDAHVKSPFHMDLGIKVFGNYELFK